MNRNVLMAFAFFLFSSAVSLDAAVKLPKIFSDNMVIQRDKPVKVWGWADKNTSLSLTFNGQTVKTKANGKGIWMATFQAMSHGGPFEMKISAPSNTLILKNILIGDVWLGSGQSNMEWVVKNSNDAEKEIAEANYDKLRLFTVDQAMSYRPGEDVTGGPWEVCNSATVGNFSAVAYFFGRKLLKELDVPIGMINSSWGGTLIETWISWDVMSMEENYKKLDPKEQERMAKETQKNLSAYQLAIKNDKGISEKWFEPTYEAQAWKKMDLPLEWGSTEFGKSDGIVWFRKEIVLPSDVEGQKGLIGLGPIDDWDETYVNGKLIGSMKEYNKDRQYVLDPGILKSGKNLIVVKVTDTGGGGGLHGKKDQLFLEANGKRLALHGDWAYKSSALTTDFGIKDTGPNAFPSQLYNAMIAPLIQFGIKGMIWYQGEANASKALEYQRLFPSLIKDWRNKWGYEFPFFWVQLANFLPAVNQPKESEWAELREAQNKTLSVPYTGQAVAIDIGKADDIHPRNKQDVGYRLALSALKVAYDKNVVYSGPVYKSMSKEGNKIVLTFTHVGSGLQAKGDKYGYLRGFSIADADKKFVWAKAYIDGDRVIIENDSVKDPSAVRYGWADNPDDANLFNKEGLPASPFKTDN